MILSRPADVRGRGGAGWLDSRHTFSFGQYHDPQWMGFGALRVINEDVVAPGAGFAPHRHANMEILSYVLSGALAHRDSIAGALRQAQGERTHILRPGELQWMSAGHGIEHSEFNASDKEAAHFLQVWIQPDRVNATPAYAQRCFERSARRARWALLASPDGADGSLAIRQQARLLGAWLEGGDTVDYALDPRRRYWLHVAQGLARVDGIDLPAGSALGFEGEGLRLRVSTAADADLLLFDLPA